MRVVDGLACIGTDGKLPSFLPSLAAGAKGKGKGTGGKRKAEAAPAAAKKGRAKKA